MSVKINYWCDELGGPIGEEMEIAWWRGDIGAIQVRIGPKEWLTVQATDPRWSGKTFEDVQQHFSRADDPEGREDTARDRAVVDRDRFAQHQSALHGLIFTGMTTDMLREAEEDFRRHTVSASRMLNAPEPDDLFAGVVDLAATTEAHVTPTPDAPQPAPMPQSVRRSDTRPEQPSPPTPAAPPETDLDDLME